MSFKISNKKKYPTGPPVRWNKRKSWKNLRNKLPKPKKKENDVGRHPVDLRQVINGIFYVLRSGCSWRMLPNDYPCWQTIYGYFNSWSKADVWEKINVELVKQVRKKTKKANHKKKFRKKKPTAGTFDT